MNQLQNEINNLETDFEESTFEVSKLEKDL